MTRNSNDAKERRNAAHSTDYRTPAALHDLLASHFAILKVRPELGAAYRKAVVAIDEWLPISGKSGILT